MVRAREWVRVRENGRERKILNLRERGETKIEELN